LLPNEQVQRKLASFVHQPDPDDKKNPLYPRLQTQFGRAGVQKVSDSPKLLHDKDILR
jgi:hypothetical protein